MESLKEKTRRGFFRSLLRNGLLIGFGVFSVHQIAKRRQPQDRGTCIDPQGRIGCRSCGEFEECRLPRAKSLRQFQERKERG